MRFCNVGRCGLRLVVAALAGVRKQSFPEPSVVDGLYAAVVDDPRWPTDHGQEKLTAQLEELLLDPEQSVREEEQGLLGPLDRTGQ